MADDPGCRLCPHETHEGACARCRCTIAGGAAAEAYFGNALGLRAYRRRAECPECRGEGAACAACYDATTQAMFEGAFRQRALFPDMVWRRRTSYHIDPRDGMAVLDD